MSNWQVAIDWMNRTFFENNTQLLLVVSGALYDDWLKWLCLYVNHAGSIDLIEHMLFDASGYCMNR